MQVINLDNSIWSIDDLIEFLKCLDNSFIPPFRTRIKSFEFFVKKMCRFGKVYVACDNHAIHGVIGFYCNDIETKCGYITYLAVHPFYHGKGLSNELISACIMEIKKAGMQTITVRTDSSNFRANQFYMNNGFYVDKKTAANHDKKGKLFLKFEI